MTIHLRDYQQAAIDATWDFLRTRQGAPCIVMATGSGKTPVIVAMVQEAVAQWQGRVLVLTHVKELIEQIHGTMLRMWPDAPVGLNSAGLGQRDTDTQILIAGIQSVFRDPTALGRRDLIFIDECDLISPDSETMYQKLLATLLVINPTMRYIGLTASPFRLSDGMIYGPEKMFEGISYEAKIRDLIDQGYLSNLRGKAGDTPDLSGVHIRGGEFIPGELDAAVNTLARVKKACEEIVRHGADRKSWIVFACSVEHAFSVKDQMEKHVACAIIIGDTDSDERRESIRAFRAGELRCLINVNVLTVGFDHPGVDLIALLRPTLSARLYLQQVGRGLRIAPGKKDAMILDFAGNISRFGPIDCLHITDKTPGSGESKPAPTKTCPQCSEILPLSSTQCNFCGYEFPRETAKHDTKAADASPLAKMEDEWVDVKRVDWTAHSKKGAPPGAPKTMRIIYEYGYGQSISEYVCIEHSGYARQKAETWWLECTGSTDIFPIDSANAVLFLDALKRGGKPLRLPKRLLIRFGGQWPELIGREYGVATAVSEPTTLTQEELDEIPF